MVIPVLVTVEADRERADVVDLVLLAGEGSRWRKRYHGMPFLALDADELGLVEQLPAVEGTKPKLRLRQEATVETELLESFRFLRLPGS